MAGLESLALQCYINTDSGGCGFYRLFLFAVNYCLYKFIKITKFNGCAYLYIMDVRFYIVVCPNISIKQPYIKCRRNTVQIVAFED